MSNEAIRQLFETRLGTWADSQGLMVEYQNQDFTPPNNPNSEDNLYLRAFLLPASTVNQFLDGAHRSYRGVFQINIVCPSGVGSAAGNAIVAALVALFPTNLRLTNLSGFAVQQTQPLSEFPAIEGPSTYTIPLSSTYRADVVG